MRRIPALFGLKINDVKILQLDRSDADFTIQIGLDLDGG